MSTWQVEYENDVPVRMRWTGRSDDARTVRRCPRTWPHEPHRPWFTGEIFPAGSATSFDCPGVEIEQQTPALDKPDKGGQNEGAV